MSGRESECVRVCVGGGGGETSQRARDKNQIKKEIISLNLIIP